MQIYIFCMDFTESSTKSPAVKCRNCLDHLSLIYKMKDETSPMYIPTYTHVFTATPELPWFNWSFWSSRKSVRWPFVNKIYCLWGQGSLCGLCFPCNSSYLNPKQKWINRVLGRMYTHCSFVLRFFIQQENEDVSNQSLKQGKIPCYVLSI